MFYKHVLIACLTVCLTGGVNSLRCFSCDGICGCLNPTTTDCSVKNQCYTVKRLSDGKIIRKGCTTDCNMVNDFDGMCTLCRGPNCNIETSLTPMSGYDDCQNQLGQGHRHSQDGLGQNISNQGGLGQPQPGAQGVGGSLGQNYQPQQSGGLGQGYQPQQSGGLGQGYQPQQSGGLGQGYQPQQPGGLSQGPLNGGGNLNYQPAPSIGASRYNDDNGMNQGFNNNGMRQAFGNSVQVVGLSLLAAAGAALFGLNRA